MVDSIIPTYMTRVQVLSSRQNLIVIVMKLIDMKLGGDLVLQAPIVIKCVGWVR